MKVAIGGFIHESNSFSSELTTKKLFDNWILTEADQLVQVHRGNRRLLGGYVDYGEKEQWEIVPLIGAAALPAGPITKDTYDYIKSEMIQRLRGQAVDGVLLHLHGAAVAQGYEDCEGDLLTAIRQEIGPQVPVMLVLDLHANVSEQMVHESTAIFGYNYQPHTDMYEREWEAADLLKQIKEKGMVVQMSRVQPPILLPAILTGTDRGPMKTMMDLAYDLEKQEGVINVSPFAGFYGSDKREAGASVVVVTENDMKLARKIAEVAANKFWEIKEEFLVAATPVERAISRAKKEGGLWAFIDESDDPLGGGPGDGTYILQALISEGISSAGISAIHDPQAVQQAYEAGLGASVTCSLGAKKDCAHGSPVQIHGKVVRLFHEKIPVAYWDHNDLQDPGRVAVLDQNGILIVVTEHKTATENINIFAYLDLPVEDFRVIVLKGLGHAYKNVFKDLPTEYVTIDSPGVTNPDVTKLGNFKNLRRPIYPLDKGILWEHGKEKGYGN